MSLPGSVLDPLRVYGKEMVLLTVRFAIGSAGAVTVDTTDWRGFGATAIDPGRGTIVRDSVGQYTITLPGRGSYPDFMVVGQPNIEVNGNDLICEVEAISTTNRTIQLQCKALDREVRNHVKTTADSMASDTTAEVIFAVAPCDGRITAAAYTPAAALTADNTNNATINVHNYNAGTDKVAATITTNVASGNWTAYTPKALTVSGTEANVTVAKGDILTINIAKAGSGVVVPAGALRVFVEPISECASGDSITLCVLARNTRSFT